MWIKAQTFRTNFLGKGKIFGEVEEKTGVGDRNWKRINILDVQIRDTKGFNEK